MAIKEFKEIVDRKGYLVESEDRKIFEKEISKSNFGLGCADMIEFILYDNSDNQLPQGDEGKLVRYIDIDDSNIREYFLLSENKDTRKADGTSEFIVDTEKLIREAGYNNGIFKTQITLLNRRAGKEYIENDNLWIHEISPSRTEIRLLPNRSSKKIDDLEKRYSVFVDDKTFRDDVIYKVKDYLKNVDLQLIFETFLKSKGKVTDGEQYVKLIQKEFKIDDFELFINRVKGKFLESMDYYVDKKNWKILDINYGKPLGDELDCIELSIKQLETDIESSLINCIDYFLPKRDIQVDNILTPEEQITMDKLKSILKTTTSDSIYDSTEPDEIKEKVRGCMDPNASNYNPKAEENDGSCKYESVSGCTDSTAKNYNPLATIDDGKCLYVQDTIKKQYFVWSAVGSITYINVEGESITKTGKEYDSFTCVHRNGQVTFEGDIREVPKLRIEKVTKRHAITNNGAGISNMMNVGIPISVQYQDEIGNTKFTRTIGLRETIYVCGVVGSFQNIIGVSILPVGDCGGSNIVANQGSSGTGGGGFGGGPITGPGLSDGPNDIPTPGAPGAVQGPQTSYNIK